MTQEEIINALQDDKTMPFIQPDQLARIVDFVSENYKPSLPGELEEAAKEYAKTSFTRPYSDTPEETIIIIEPDKYAGFIAGAEWQEKQTPLPEDTTIFLKGVAEGKRLMLEEAVEHYVIGEIAGSPVGPAIVHYDDNLTIGDKVKVIVIKEDEL